MPVFGEFGFQLSSSRFKLSHCRLRMCSDGRQVAQRQQSDPEHKHDDKQPVKSRNCWTKLPDECVSDPDQATSKSNDRRRLHPPEIAVSKMLAVGIFQRFVRALLLPGTSVTVHHAGSEQHE